MPFVTGDRFEFDHRRVIIGGGIQIAANRSYKTVVRPSVEWPVFAR